MGQWNRPVSGMGLCSFINVDTGYLLTHVKYLVGPLDGIKNRKSSNATKIVTSTTDEATAGAEAAAAAETAIVFISSDSGEGCVYILL